jgi:hypothetical protein
MLMASQQGEVLEIPAEGVRSMLALGWTQIDQPDPEPHKRISRKRTTKPKE